VANRFWKGLKKSEMVIALALSAVLIFIIISRYENFKCRSINSEAKFYLKEIYAAQMLFRADFARFASLQELRDLKRIAIMERYYDYGDEKEPTELSFFIKALGKKDTLVANDAWSIDDKSALKHELKFCGYR